VKRAPGYVAGAKVQIYRRAQYWYTQALPHLDEPVRKTTAEKLRLVEQHLPSQTSRWARLNIAEAIEADGLLELGPQQKIVTREAFAVPIEILVEAGPRSTRLVSALTRAVP